MCVPPFLEVEERVSDPLMEFLLKPHDINLSKYFPNFIYQKFNSEHNSKLQQFSNNSITDCIQ